MNFGEKIVGKISFFGGPKDMGVSPSEGLALYNKYEENPYLFLDEQPEGTAGLARRLNPRVFYCAMRWAYDITPKSVLRNSYVKIKFGNKAVTASPVDWGPHERTGRVIDVSPGVMNALKCTTDDEVECTLVDTTGVKVVGA